MPASFDRLAGSYRYLEYAAFGSALWRRRIAFLPRLAASRRVLMAGEGDGRFLAAFLDLNREAVVDYVDASPRMLELARSRAGSQAARVRFLQLDLLNSAQLSGTYDTVVTHFFLDCFSHSELDRLVVLIHAFTARNAQWIVSEFQTKPFGSRLLIRCLYLFFGAMTGLSTTHLPDYRQALSKVGFRMVEEESSLGGILVSEQWRRL